MQRPFDKHIDAEELNAIARSRPESGQELHGLSADAVRDAWRHVESCGDCSRKVSKYLQLINRLSNAEAYRATSPGPYCPKDGDVEWHEVAAGLWPELKSKQLILHAALCEFCGPRLRAATSVDDDPTPQEEKFLAQLEAPFRPMAQPQPEPTPDFGFLLNWRQFLRWKIVVPAVALILAVAVLTRPSSSPAPLSGAAFAEFAVRTHRQHAEGSLALDVRSDSQQILNQWFKAKLPFSLALPGSPAAPGASWPNRLEGARLVQVGGETAAYVSYQMQGSPVSLMVAPDSVAHASGGIKVDFKKLSFHYRMVEGYKVVTWSLQGRTYALISNEGNGTQQSCMVCHSAMRDRDLSKTPTPLSGQPALQ